MQTDSDFNLKETFISIVLLHRNLSDSQKQCQELSDFLAKNYSDFEVLLISRNSDFANVDYIQDIPGMRFIKLVGEVSDSLSYAAGLENCIGDIAVTMELDDISLEEVKNCIEKLDDKTQAVFGRNQFLSNSFLYSGAYRIFNLLAKYTLGIEIPRGLTTFKVITRESLNIAFTRKKLLSQLDFCILQHIQEFVFYDYDCSSSKKNLVDGLRKAFDLLVFNSTALLRLFNLLGLAGGGVAFCISLYVFMINLLRDNVMEGWTSLSLFLSAQFCILFLILFVYGEYLARLVDERWMSQEYDILFDKRGPSATERMRWNIKMKSD
jgi:hypothetical protein